MKNRLQFIHHDEVFATREEAIQYVKDIQVLDRPALYAEPMILKYESGDAVKGPNIILAIGSEGNGQGSISNRTFFVDIAAAESAIEDIEEQIEELIHTLNIVTENSNTLVLNAEKTPDGTVLSGNVKLADSKVIHTIERPNTVQETANGIYHYVSLNYDSNTAKLTFQVNEDVSNYTIPVVVSGEYVYTGDDAETIILTMSDGTLVKIPVGKLINEWVVMPADANNTPIVLTRDETHTSPRPHGVEDWQDILSADIRLHEGDGNIIYKTDGGRTVFATVSLDYVEVENKLVFKWSEEGQVKSKDITLNSINAIEYIRYDHDTEEIVIGYKTSPSSSIVEVRIPVGDMIQEWTPVSEGHNVLLVRDRNVSGTDTVFADVRIADASVAPNNIIETVGDNHALSVRGEADNIKFGASNVDAELKRLVNEDARIEGKFDNEISVSRNTEDELENKIGTGFTSDSHDNVTAKFNALSNKANETSNALTEEIARAKAAEIANASDIANEVARATAAEQTNATAISQERDRAVGQEGVILNTIGTAFTTDVHETITYKFNELSGKTNTVVSGLDAEITRARESEQGLSTAITNEVARATAAEQVNTESIATETSRAIAAEDTISNTIGGGFSTDIHETITYKFNELSGKTDQAVSDINAEVSRATSAEQTIADSVSAEETRAIAAEQANTDAISAEETRATAAEGVLTDKIGTGFTTDPHENVTYKFETLSSDVNTISGKVQQNTEDISTNRGDIATLNNLVAEISGATVGKVDSVTAIQNMGIYVDNTDDTNPQIGVQLKGNETNIIAHTIDGLNVEVGLSYDITKNELTLHTTKGDTKISLATASIIDRAYYDRNSEELVIVFITDTPTGKQTIRIPMGDLIREWDVENDGHTVHLTRTIVESGGTDMLSADVNISDDSDNILVRNAAGWLKVSNAPITALSTSLDAEVARAQAKEAELHNEVAIEESARTAATQTLQANIDAEAAARLSGDNTLQGNITAETTRATNKESELNTKIETETTRATDIEQTLSGQIKTINEKIGGSFDVHDTVADAIASAMTAISHETTRATGQENYLRDLISANTDSIDNLRVDFQTSTANTNNRINELNTRVGNGFNDRSITTVITEVSGASVDNESRISAEITRAQGAETALGTRISVAESKVGALETGLDSEIARATNRENTISANLNDEVSRAQGVEQGLRTDLTQSAATLSNAISTETLNRTNAEGVINDKIAALSASTGSKVASIGAGDGIDITGASTTPTISVKNSPSTGNIIKMSDGIYANVDLKYEETTNVLKFYINDSLVDEFHLSSVSLVEKIEYDSTNKAIKIYYTDAAGQTAIVSIDVEDMVQEWTIDNVGNSVLLERSTGNVVTANVKISTASDNMMETDDDGWVKVSNAPIVELSGKVGTLSGVVTSDHTKVETLTGDMNIVSANVASVSAATVLNSQKIDSLSANTQTEFSNFRDALGLVVESAESAYQWAECTRNAVGVNANCEMLFTGAHFIENAPNVKEALMILDQKIFDIYNQYISNTSNDFH